MKFVVPLFIAALVSACEAPPPPVPVAPSPEVLKIKASCDAGNIESCKFLAQLEAQGRSAAYAAAAANAQRVANTFAVPVAPIQQTYKIVPPVALSAASVGTYPSMSTCQYVGTQYVCRYN